VSDYTCTECEVTFPDFPTFVSHSWECSGWTSEADDQRDEAADRKAAQDMLAGATDLVRWGR
jgi:hypothetical protein